MLRPSLRYPRKLPEDVPTGSISFTIGDAETPAGTLAVTSSSSNKILVPDANIIITGSGSATRIVRITPASNRNGSTTITLTVSDGTATTQTTFTLTVTPVDDAADNHSTESSNNSRRYSDNTQDWGFYNFRPGQDNGTYRLIILPGANYTAAGNIVTPNKDFDGELFCKGQSNGWEISQP